MIDLRDLDRYRFGALERRILGLSGLPLEPSMRGLVGAFGVPSPIDHAELRVIASAVWGWDHVSVSRPKRCPNWPEMGLIKTLFFKPEECAMQLHVPENEHINNHPFCLHLWRPHHQAIPRPPGEFVGMVGVSADETRQLARALEGRVA